MGSQFPKPQRTHAKTISVTSETSREIINISSIQRKKKFGSGKYAEVELDPQPSDCPQDPLNWPQWKKELAYGSLLLSTAVISIFKMMLVTVGGVLEAELTSSWEGVAALTGVPIILGGLFGLKSVIISRMIGKRTIYLLSSIGLLLSSLWTMHVTGNYKEFLISRAFSGICWGSFEALVVISIKDMFFMHERSSRITIYNVVSIIFTWGSPMLGGYVSQINEGYKNQIMVVNIMQAASIVLVIFITPETTYNRDRSNDLRTLLRATTITTISAPPSSGLKVYLSSLRPTNPNATSKFQLSTVLLYIRAFFAPTVALGFLLTGPIYATAIAVSYLLPLLFTTNPNMELPNQLGLLFLGPLVASVIGSVVVGLASYVRSRPLNDVSTRRRSHLGSTIPGSLIGCGSLIGFGFYIDSGNPVVPSAFGNAWRGDDEVRINENLVTLIFGLLVSGTMLTHIATVNHIRSASRISVENDALESAYNVLQSILTGLYVVGMPLWVGGNEGFDMFPTLKLTVLGMALVQIVIAGAAAGLLLVTGEFVMKLDGRVLGRREAVEEEDGKWRGEDIFMDR
ncbi:hypothetical protein HYFRA_00001247 [Hymenoscyphus fraxineus]|uniref:Major facilitator superfamily (MFS) profile domain-containing protein n=1 Tax=Hymenoscyphus fraxineus TaxID=746836 RepID=A0A9N9KUR4_9HELO|nr:hypothetical protein HYFRA_00001247 [Hymenoscyphus fraxineus]